MKLGAGFTVTGIVRVVDPPLPAQVMLYVVVTAGETAKDPETSDGEKPVPLQEVALVDDHDIIDEAPLAMPPGLALNESVGAVGDASARLLRVAQPVRSSSKATCHHVAAPAFTGPPITTPWLPDASEPIVDALCDGVG